MRRIVVLVQFLTAAALVALFATGTVAQNAPTAQAAQGQGRGLEGIKWALGMTTADVTPRPFPKSPSTQAAPKDPLPEDAGKDTVLRVCGGCHAIEMAVSTRGNEKEWREIVDLMIERGATGTEEDLRTVVTYLATHFGAKR